MKKTLFTLLSIILIGINTSISANCCCEQSNDVNTYQECCESFRYITVGVGPLVLIPNVGIGYRIINGRHGIDASLNFSTIIEAHQFQGQFDYLFIVNPNNPRPFYVGAGVAPSYLFTNHGDKLFAIAPDFVFGKEIGRGRQFIEAHIQAPSWFSSSHNFHHNSRLSLPMVYVKYGIGF